MRAIRQRSEILVYLLLAITGINLLQIAFTELIMDEAYYWYFSRELAWGYFDHPPMVAFLIHLGTEILPGEAGVRFFTPFMYSASLLLLWDITDHPMKKDHPWLFFWFTGSLGLLAAFGFFILPDAPLFFFSVLMLWVYKKHLHAPGIATTLGLGICMAAIMYSKYHGALFILFVILSRPANLRSGKIWAAILTGFLLYLPHLYWLYRNDFVSISYHLVERANSAYQLKFTLHFLLNALAIGGLVFPLVYYAVFKAPVRSSFDRALKVIFYGFLIFFLFSSFTRKTQIQWINLINIPFIILSFRYALDHLQYRKWLYRLSVVSVILLCYVRLALVFPVLSPIPYETHGNKKWAESLYTQSNGLPVVFHNSYRDAAIYSYYSGARVYSLNDVGFRRNQFDIDHSEKPLRGKPVVLLSQRPLENATISYTRPFKHKDWSGVVIDSFENYSKLRFKIDQEEFTNGVPAEITAMLHNPYSEQVPLNKLRIEGVTYDDNRKIIDTFALKARDPDLVLPAGKSIQLRLKTGEVKKGEKVSYFHIGLGHYGFRPGFEGNMVTVHPLERDP
ncbi:ArnT family glycosyltransferase [Robertkochia flava]|uniref:ArnT family glycosyltransferase n=1 Tax=Robertkochia flava TaxID=3447986 RepID=UPI001CCFCF5B|nr:glycosyltransferase family 39 protein [Robertkochia marina]